MTSLVKTSYLKYYPEDIPFIKNNIELIPLLQRAGICNDATGAFAALAAFCGKEASSHSFQNHLCAIHFAALGGQKNLINQMSQKKEWNLTSLDRDGHSVLYYARLGNHGGLAIDITCQIEFLVARSLAEFIFSLCGSKLLNYEKIDYTLKAIQENSLHSITPFDFVQNKEKIQTIFQTAFELQNPDLSLDQKLVKTFKLVSRLYEQAKKHPDPVFDKMLFFFKNPYKSQSIKKIGEGSFGSVGKIFNIIKNCFYAIKAPKADLDQQKELQHESTILDYIAQKDPQGLERIIRKFDVIEISYTDTQETRMGLILELKGPTLCEWTETKHYEKNSFILTKKLGKQILEGISFLHKIDLIHCDLKPENILMDKDLSSNIKIADFGSSFFKSKPLPERKRYPHKIQSPAYRAPESTICSHNYSFPIDIWGVGCILWEIFTQNILFGFDKEYSDRFHIATSERLEEIHTFLLGPYPVLEGRRIPKSTGPIAQITSLKEELSSYTKTAETAIFCDLMEKLLDLNPTSRISAETALVHPFFT